jgi:hypothetical protein
MGYGGSVPHEGCDKPACAKATARQGGNGFRFSEFGLFFDIGTHLVLGDVKDAGFESRISGFGPLKCA